MSNSPLVNYTKLSPNHSGKRNHAIDTVTIHCMASNASVEALGAWFAKKEAQASSNYGIDSNGRIGLYVEEGNRSWCSSNGANDNRAVTIEVANTAQGEPWPISDAAYVSLINLLVDICQRNGIPRLLWMADKSLIGQVDKQNMTVHRWFANKSCPGNWLYEHHAQIAAEVNARLGAEAPAPVPEAAPVSESPNEAIIWSFLREHGLSAVAAAGVMGNLYAESGLKPTNLQNSFEHRLSMTDAEYTAAVDAGRYGNFVKDGAGYGIAQWTYWTRKQGLYEYAKAQGTSIGSLTMQLAFLWKELQESAIVRSGLASARTVREASDLILLKFERPADQSEAVQEKRAAYGQTYYNKFTQEDEVMDQATFNKMFKTAMAEYRQELRDNDSGGWSQEARDFAVQNGIFNGGAPLPDGTPNFMWEDLLTREQAAQLFYNFAKRTGMADAAAEN